ncbi:MAG TPA: TonB family protein [Thermoanaerobaculia bacterium]|nr:TonB family protein [Thermoanaerobaculia bacterium]
MSENILVVEYEPRYTDRVRQALTGQPFNPTFAKDGEEAMRALDGASPRLIVLSSVVPKVSTTELIRAIRGRNALQNTPILLTVSGYNGKSPQQDAQRVGASDILPKPYSETEFLGKVQQMLGVTGDATVKLTSNEIFGDLVDDKPAARKPNTGSRTSGDVDKMLSDTLGGMMPKKREPVSSPTVAVPKPKSTSELDKMLSDTLSGLEKSARKNTSPGATPRPATPAPPPPMPDPARTERFDTAKMQAYVQQPDRVPVSQPVLTPPEPQRVFEDEEPTDGIRFGQYVLIEKIATGGMAEVWKARMRGVEGFQKIVAIKKILPHLSDNQDFIEMFVDEAKLAAQLNHNNIIHIYDLGKIQSSYYIAMEFVDGYDLKTILRRGEDRGHPMTVELALFIASKLASALDYAHRKKDFEEKEMGLVHRDVSPQNVLVSQEGDIKLCDFGIAKAASKASHTQAGALKGKLQYMSPEQAWGRTIDRRSDIFALATVLFEMLTNRKLFTGDNELSILEQVREARVQPPSLYNDEVTPEIDKAVIKALQKDPTNRYQTAGEMARDLDAILYSFKPTPTSADLAIYMHRISTPEPEPFDSAATMIDTPLPVVAPAPPAPAPAPAPVHSAPATVATPMPAAAAAVAAAPMAMPQEYDQPKSGKSPVMLAVIGLIVLGVIAAAAWYFMRGSSKPAAAKTVAAATTTSPITTTAAPLTGTVVPVGTDTAATGTLAAPTTTALDQSAVDQEVARRLAAERARLEAQNQQQQQTQTVAPARPVPPPVQTQTAAPEPVREEPRPVPPPPVQTQTAAPEPVREEPRPEPQVARAREGDLVPAGTPGLTAPRLTRRGAVTYPPIARAQRVQGVVIMSVLVNENGNVVDVKVIRGVPQPVGLNEAAIQTMRRSSFSPATKDGVRVKSYVTVPIEFKL